MGMCVITADDFANLYGGRASRYVAGADRLHFFLDYCVHELNGNSSMPRLEPAFPTKTHRHPDTLSRI